MSPPGFRKHAALSAVVFVTLIYTTLASWLAGAKFSKKYKPLAKKYEPPPHAINIPKMHISEFNYTYFQEHFEHKLPLVLTGIVSEWPANKWTYPLLSDAAGPYSMLTSGDKYVIGRPRNPFRSELQHRLDKGKNMIDPRSVHSEPLASDCPFRQVSGQTPESSAIFGTNYIAAVHAHYRKTAKKIFGESVPSNLRIPQQAYFIAGGAGQGGKMHLDPYAVGFWNAQVRGRKRWMFISDGELQTVAQAIVKHPKPKVRAKIEQLLEDYAVDRKGNRLKIWDIKDEKKRIKKALTAVVAEDFYGLILPALDKANISYNSSQVVMEEGDLVYGPDPASRGRSWHVVLALEDSVGCTEQLVSDGNLDRFIMTSERKAADVHVTCTILKEHYPTKLSQKALDHCEQVETKAMGSKKKATSEL